MNKLIYVLTTSLCYVSIAGCTQLPATKEPAKSDIAPVQQPSPPQAETTIPKPAQPALPPAKQSNLAPVPTASPQKYVINPKTFDIVDPADKKKKILLLTFDDGPTGASTHDLINVLDKHNAKAIWFINGHQIAHKKADGHFSVIPEKAALLKELKQHGQIIGNHTWNHENLKTLPLAKQRDEIVSTNELVQSLIGEKPKFFRPPFGASTDEAKKICKEQGMLSMNWSVGSLDWEPKVYKKPGAIGKQVLSTVHKGGNILFHDRKWTAEQLDSILTQLEKDGYSFVVPTEAL